MGADVGPNPTLPVPTTSIIPTVNIAPAKGWPADVAFRTIKRRGLLERAVGTRLAENLPYEIQRHLEVADLIGTLLGRGERHLDRLVEGFE